MRRGDVRASMASVTSRTGGERSSGAALVDPRAPRFGQALTAAGLVAGVALGEPLLVLAVAVVLDAALLSGWRLDLYGALWRRAVRPVVGRAEPEPAAPHRFAKLLGAGMTTLATVLLFAAPVVGLPALALAGYGVAALVAALAGLAATTGVCIGCRMYRQVSFLRRLGVV